MSDTLKVSDVFVPGKLPALTYNPRGELHLEQKVTDYLDEGGAILTVAGPTKTGKSVLLRRVIDEPLWLDGQAIKDADDLWTLLADELGLFPKVERSSDRRQSGGGEVGSQGGFLPVLTVSAKAQYSAAEGSGESYGVSRPMVSVVKEAIADSGRAVVIDDFHFIARETQREIVRALKPSVLAGVPVIFVSISHRVQDVISAEPDMTGRVQPLEVGFWDHTELLVIAQKGFDALGVMDPGGKLATRLATESYGSPHLMQKFCRELCKAQDVREQQVPNRELVQPDDWDDFFKAQVDSAAGGWFERLLTGPQERGNRRTQWQIRGNGTLDGYGLTLLAIRSSGPKLTLTKDEIKAAVDGLVDGEKPVSGQTTRVLQHMSRIAAKRMTETPPTEEQLDEIVEDVESIPDVQPVLEYMDDDPNSKLHIVDPFFAFFLKWGSGPYLEQGHPVPPRLEFDDRPASRTAIEDRRL